MCLSISLASFRLSLFGNTRYGSFAAVVARGKPLKNHQAAAPIVLNALQACDMMLRALPYSSATLVNTLTFFRLFNDSTLDIIIQMSSTGLTFGHITLKKHLDVVITDIRRLTAFTELLSIHRGRALYLSIAPTIRHAASICMLVSYLIQVDLMIGLLFRIALLSLLS